MEGEGEGEGEGGRGAGVGAGAGEGGDQMVSLIVKELWEIFLFPIE